MGLLRPDKDHPKRFLFNWAHRTLGISSLVLASNKISLLFIYMGKLVLKTALSIQFFFEKCVLSNILIYHTILHKVRVY